MEKKYLLLRILVLFFTGVLFSACQKEGLIAPQNDALEEEIMAGAFRAGLHDSSLPVNPYFELDSIGKPTQIFRETVNSTTLKNTMKTKHQPTRILPTGYYLAPNQSITVNVQLQSGSTLPKLQIGTHSRYHDYSYNPPIYNLTTGANTITANSDGGIVWIIYEQPQGTSGTPVSEARVTFGGSIARIPVFIKNKTTQTSWQSQLSSYNAIEDVLMVGKNVYMVYSKNGHAGVATQDNNAVLDFADTSWEHHYALAGLDNSSYVHTRPSVPHLMVQTDVPYGLYYTFPYRTAYGYDTDRIFGENTNQWGIWHEFGHMQQQTPVDWDGLGEVTVNIFSLSAERAFEVTPNRITADNYWPDAKAFIQQTGAKNFNDNNVWIKLIMFHQLWLAYGDSFYTTLQRAVREDGGSYPDSHAKLKNFMLKACQISGHNLTEFFKKWGIQDTSGDIYPALAALGLPKPIVNPAYYTDTEKPLLENGATYQIVTALNNSSVVNVSSSNPVNGTAVNLWSNTGNATQKFLARKLSDGSYALKSLADTSKVLAVKGASGTAGALIHTYTFDNGVAQRWTPELSGGGYYLLKSSVASNRYMDIQSSGTANGTAILTWGKTSNNNQKFRFVKQ